MKGEVCLKTENLERHEEAEKGFKYILNILKKDDDDKVGRKEIESSVLSIYKILKKEKLGNEALKRINADFKRRHGISA
jgi:hypothetical protein